MNASAIIVATWTTCRTGGWWPAAVSAAVEAPKQEGLDFRVFLVDNRADTAVELKPSGDGLYTGEYQLSRKHPLGETILTVAAILCEAVYELVISLRRGI